MQQLEQQLNNLKRDLEALKLQVQKGNDKMMNSQEVMDFLSIGRSTFNTWMKNGVLKAYRLNGGKLLFKRSEVMNTIEAA